MSDKPFKDRRPRRPLTDEEELANAPEGAYTTDELGRRVWNKAYWANRAESALADTTSKDEKKLLKQKLLKEAPRTFLKQREGELHLEREIGKQKIVAATAAEQQQGGFWCTVCQCLLKDSASYLDHINGKKHNRLLGMSMRVKKASKTDVAARLQAAKERQRALKEMGATTAKQ